MEDEQPPQAQDSNGGTLDSSMECTLVPPPGEFIAIKKVYQGESRVEWLCLPRHNRNTATLEAPAEQGEAHMTANQVGEDFQMAASEDDAVLEPHAVARFKNALESLVLVKMYHSPSVLRNESNVRRLLYEHNNGRALDFIDAWILHEVHSTIPADCWLCLEPVFGKSLEAFGQTCLSAADQIPESFVWHIFLGLVAAVRFIHDAGIPHGNLNTTNVMLRCSSPSRQHRDWPDVVVTGFEVEEEMELPADEKREDVRRVAKMVHGVITQWSVWSGLIPPLGHLAESNDPFLRFTAALQALIDSPLQGTDLVSLEAWKVTAVIAREKGTEGCPDWLRTAANDALVTEEELEAAMVPPLVLKFGPDSETFKQWVRARRSPVALRKRSAKHKRCGILVVTFKVRKALFANLTRQSGNWGESLHETFQFLQEQRDNRLF